MNRIKRDEKGVIALEASVSLTLFIFIVLLLYSFFIIFEAQYSIEHALLESGKSMALESYAISKVIEKKDKWYTAGDIGSIIAAMGLGKSAIGNNYSSYTTWYASEELTAEEAKRRVEAYLGGTEADSYLKRLKVKDGINGLNFAGTKVEGGDLVIKVKFTCNTIFDFPAFELDHIDFSLSVRSAMWK